MHPAGSGFEPAQTDSSSSSSRGFFGAGSRQPLWVGTPTNQAICRHQVQELLGMAAQQQGQEGQPGGARQPLFELLSGVAVQSMERVGSGCGGGGGWALRGSRQGRAAAALPVPEQQEELGSYDAVILADSMPLLPGSAGHVAGIEAAASSLAQLARSVQAVAPQPCFALMVAFRQPLPGVPFDSASVGHPEGAVGSSSSAGGGDSGSSSSGGSAFQWVACNSSKPGRPGSEGGAPQCWVALTTTQRAQRLLLAHPLIGPGGRLNPQTAEYRAAVAEELMADFRALMQPFVQVRGPLARLWPATGVCLVSLSQHPPLVCHPRWPPHPGIACTATCAQPPCRAPCQSRCTSLRSVGAEPLWRSPWEPSCSSSRRSGWRCAATWLPAAAWRRRGAAGGRQAAPLGACCAQRDALPACAGSVRHAQQQQQQPACPLGNS